MDLLQGFLHRGRLQFRPPGARASRPHNAWHSLGHLPPLGSTGNGAMALLRPGRCGYCRRSGCLQSRAEAQRPPKGQHAGGTPALPGAITPPLEGEPQKPSRQAKADAVGGRSAPGNRYFFMNIDAQDAQDKQDEGLLRGELTPAMIRCGFATARDYRTPDSQRQSCISRSSM